MTEDTAESRKDIFREKLTVENRTLPNPFDINSDQYPHDFSDMPEFPFPDLYNYLEWKNGCSQEKMYNLRTTKLFTVTS